MTKSADELRQSLVARLVESGELVSPEWRRAYERVPRHVFVPRVIGCWPPDGDGREDFVLDRSDPDRWLELVYSDRLLIIVDDGERLSSSSAPGVMARFLEFLDVRDGNSALEIGTGSGYNAALLCERLGSKRVTSIDIDMELVEAARPRLAACGYTPALAVADGWAGHPARAPYDRIIATCSVPRIPDPWIDQLRTEGVVVTPLRGGRFDGVGLVALRLAGDGSLSGRLHRRGAAFMRMRDRHDRNTGTTANELRALIAEMEGESRPCTIPRYMVDRPEPRLPPNFLLRLNETVDWEWFWPPGPDGEPRGRAVAAPDGSWARVVMREPPVVYQGGPRRLWDLIERNWELYLRLGKPGMDRYGITVTQDRQQFIWLDSPDSEHRWQL